MVVSSAHAPELREPNTARVDAALGQAQGQTQRLTPEAKLTLLLAQLAELLQDTAVESTNARLELLKAQRAHQKASFERLSQSLNQAEGELAQKLEQAQSAGEEAQRALQAANRAAERVRQLQAQLAATSPSDPNHASLNDQLRQASGQADHLRAAAQTALGVSDAANAGMEAALDEVNRLDAEIERLVHVAPPSLSPPRAMTNAAKLSELLATLNQLISENSLLKLEADTKLTKDLLKSQEAENTRRSEEYQAEQAKAAQLEKTMGCIGKIVGWLITVVAVIAAPFSGGASLALAAVGLALVIVEEATGFSVLGKAFEPIMQHVLMPLINAISKGLTQMLENMGVDAAVARKVGSILGAVIGAAVMVAVIVLAVVVGRSAAANLLKQIGPMINKMMARVMPQILKDASASMAAGSAKLTGALTKALGSTVDDMGARMGKVLVATQVTQFASSVGSSAGNVVAADIRVEAETIMGELMSGLENSKLIRESLEDAQQEFIKANEIAMSFLAKMSDVMEQSLRSGNFVVNNIRHA
ncbi:type III secretion system translocon subunit SctE [Pseudoxanthomonas sp. UTMC 1351]|uniref:type III secretion system translocon subunit SctE n=1 Tax=Pseudoxanthomonas sp. UTMC 1351 TaxID=2695853 RepID=UPI0034CEAD87